MLQATFAAEPRPSVAEREALARQTGLEAGTVTNWFDAERKRVKAAAPPAPPGAEAPAGDAPAGGDSPEGAAAAAAAGGNTPGAAMRKRKAAAGGAPAYEAPADEAARAALAAALAAEAAALQEALDEPAAELFALLPAGSVNAAQPPQLNRAVRRPSRALLARLRARRGRRALSSRQKRQPYRRCRAAALPSPARR